MAFRAGGELDEREGEGPAGADADAGWAFCVTGCVGADKKRVEDVRWFERFSAGDQSSVEATA